MTQCFIKQIQLQQAMLDGTPGTKLEKKNETVDRCSLPNIFLENPIDKLCLEFV